MTAFAFPPDGSFFINIERHIDSLHNAITVYHSKDFLIASQLMLDDNVNVCDIEYDSKTENYYVLGFRSGMESNGYFVGKYRNNAITDTVEISESVFDFHRIYLRLKRMGFTDKAYEWSYCDCELEKLKNQNTTLSNLYNSYSN